MPLILSVCKTMAQYIGIYISKPKFLEMKQRALKQEYGGVLVWFCSAWFFLSTEKH